MENKPNHNIHQIYDMFGGFIQNKYVDWDGDPITRTPETHRYSYDSFVIQKKSNEYEHVVYSDRLWQWYHEKHDLLCQKHFGDKGQYWNNRDFNKIEAFLNDFFERPIELVGIMQGCKQSSGYPVWSFFYNIKEEEIKDSCPECGAELIEKVSGGVKCTKCDYWFCY